MNTPAGTVKSPVGGRKPPVALPPPEEGELYVECDQQEEAEEYLAFEPSSDIPQEVYEAMEPTEEDVGQEVYEEPGECLHMLASFVLMSSLNVTVELVWSPGNEAAISVTYLYVVHVLTLICMWGVTKSTVRLYQS